MPRKFGLAQDSAFRVNDFRFHLSTFVSTLSGDTVGVRPTGREPVVATGAPGARPFPEGR